MKKLIFLLLLSSSAMAQTDVRVEYLCSTFGELTKECQQVVAEELDSAYEQGEQNAHLDRVEKLQKQTEYLTSSEMQTMCLSAEDKAKCGKFREYLITEFNAGIGLY